MGQLKYLGENKEKYKIFSVPIKGNYKCSQILHKIKFIDSARFIASSILNPVDNLTEGIHKIKCKECDCFLEYESVKDNLIKHKCLPCRKDYSNKLDEKLKEIWEHIYVF